MDTWRYTSLLTYLLTYLLIPWSGVLLEKLTGLQLVKKLGRPRRRWEDNIKMDLQEV